MAQPADGSYARALRARSRLGVKKGLQLTGIVPAAPDYPVYRRIIEEAWPELLTVPFNPPPRVSVRQRGSKLLRRMLGPFRSFGRLKTART